MMIVPAGVKVHLALGVTDMRIVQWGEHFFSRLQVEIEPYHHVGDVGPDHRVALPKQIHPRLPVCIHHRIGQEHVALPGEQQLAPRTGIQLGEAKDDAL